MTTKKYELYVIVLYIILILAAVLLGLSCSNAQAEGYALGYEEGYIEGLSELRTEYEDDYIVGYRDGITRAQSAIEVYLMDDILHISFEIEDDYGISPEAAINAITNYVDIPGEVTEAEFNAAVWAIRRYYFALEDIIYDVDNYWID